MYKTLLSLVLTLALASAVGQPSAVEQSVVLVGTLVVQPTQLPEPLAESEGQAVFLPIAYGTGFVVREDGYVVTAQHVIQRAQARLNEIQASFKWMVVCTRKRPGHYDCKEATLVGTDDRNDLAVLKIRQPKGESLPILSLTPEKPPRGTPIWMAGYHHGNLIVTAGSFSGIAPSQGDNASASGAEGLWLAAMAVDDGTSGGPVYLGNGSVVGVIVARSEEGRVAGFVPARHVVELLAQHGVTLQQRIQTK